MSLHKDLEREARERQQDALANMPGLRAYELGYAAGLADAARRIQSANLRDAIGPMATMKPAERSE